MFLHVDLGIDYLLFVEHPIYNCRSGVGGSNMLIPVGKLHAPVLAGVMNCYLTRGIAGGRTILNDLARQASLGLRAHQ